MSVIRDFVRQPDELADVIAMLREVACSIQDDMEHNGSRCPVCRMMQHGSECVVRQASYRRPDGSIR